MTFPTPQAALLDRLARIPEKELDQALDLVDCALTFRRFVTFAWPIIEPVRELRPNWHIDLICDAVQRQVDGDPRFRRLAIFISPGDLKSVLISVMRPAWIWLRHASRRSLYFSHSKEVARRDSRRTRQILQHPGYLALHDFLVRARISQPWTFEADQNEKHNFVNSLTGQRLCFGFDQMWTGERGDDIVIDDPVDAGVVLGSEDDAVNAFRDANDIIDNKMQSRVNDMSTATWTLMMQRLGPGDPGEAAIRDGDWHILCLPKEYNPAHPLRHPLDPRTRPGELLNAHHDNPAELDRLKRKMGPRHWMAQYGQITAQGVGGLFPDTLFIAAPRYSGQGEARIPKMTEVGMSIDCTFKSTATSDRVSIQVWGRKDWGRRTLLGRDTRRMTYSETRTAAVAMWRRFGPTFTLVEDKANGPALLEDLASVIPGLIRRDPGRASKYERAQVGTAPLYNAQQIELPDTTSDPGILDFESAHTSFRPGGDNDDDIDAESMIHIYWNEQARQAPWLDQDRDARWRHLDRPAWVHPDNDGRHYVYSPGSLSAEPVRVFVAVVPPAPTCPDVGHVGAFVVCTDIGDLIASGTGHTPDALASAVVSTLRALVPMLPRVALAKRRWSAPFSVRVVHAGLLRDTAPADRVAAALRVRELPLNVDALVTAETPTGLWRADVPALATAADRARGLAGAQRLVVHDADIGAMLAVATLHPESGVPEVPRTTARDRLRMGKPLSSDAMLVATLACLDAAAAARTSTVDAAVRAAARPDAAEREFIDRMLATYGGTPNGPVQSRLFGVLRPR